ncbi:MAG: hypothetical protein OSA24_01975 [Longimicrobiales bacterium]|jgi:uncharacterized protein YbaR (Trm112 family)|nr:hypothetical protein [Longimicrobiales bacterium]|tara:strand:- start:222 stop:479 length:258 start_codon:yes stop_codon:yes gene_type:complete
MVDKELLKILVCPQSRQPLSQASREILSQINSAVLAGTLTNKKGVAVNEPLLEGLVTQDGSVVYPVLEDIPVMLIDESISLGDLP